MSKTIFDQLVQIIFKKENDLKNMYIKFFYLETYVYIFIPSPVF